MNNKNSHKQINVQHVYYKKFIITKQFYYYKKLITKNKGERKQSGRNLQKARKKVNAKEKNLSEIYSKQGKRQGQKKNLSKIYKEPQRS